MIHTHHVNIDPSRSRSIQREISISDEEKIASMEFQDFMSLQRKFLQQIKHENENRITSDIGGFSEAASSMIHQAKLQRMYASVSKKSPDSSRKLLDSTFDANNATLTNLPHVEKIDDRVVNEVFSSEPDLAKLLSDYDATLTSASNAAEYSINGGVCHGKSCSTPDDHLVWEPIDCESDEKKGDSLDIQKAALHQAMQKTLQSQDFLQQWDREMGLKRCHSKTMTKTSQSRKKLRVLIEPILQDAGRLE